MDIKIRNKFIEIKNSISDWFVIFVTNNSLFLLKFMIKAMTLTLI